MLTQARLKELFNYDPITGIVTRKITKNYNAKQGDKVGCLSQGYLVATVDGKRYLLHRLIWLYVYNDFPKMLDHIDRNKLNNQINNLRSVNAQQNQQNKTKQTNNKSGYKGVNWDKNRNKWFSCIQHKGKTIALGRYDNVKDAYRAYCFAASKYHTHNPETNLLCDF